jgi:predicted nucleic acid-binding protein
MIATVSDWHPHHRRAIADIDRRLNNGESMLLAAPALVEAFSVLTRLPRPYRVPPSDGLALLQVSLLDHAESVVALDGDTYVRFIRDAAADTIVGGQVYDAVIAACARAANVDTLLTFNERHFRRFAGLDLAIVVPTAPEP